MKLFKSKPWLGILCGSLIVAIGVLTIVFAAMSKTSVVANVLNYAIAAVLFLFGAIFIIAGLVTDDKAQFMVGLIVACVLIALGAVLCYDPMILRGIYIIFFCSLLISVGGGTLIKMITGIVRKAKVGEIICYTSISVVALVLGILGLVYKNAAEVTIYILLGIALIAGGVGEIILKARDAKTAKADKTEKSE